MEGGEVTNGMAPSSGEEETESEVFERVVGRGSTNLSIDERSDAPNTT